MKRRFLPAVLPLVLCALPSSAFAQMCVAPSFITSPPTFAIGAAPDDIVSADFDNDGLLDIAVGDAERVQVHRNRGRLHLFGDDPRGGHNGRGGGRPK